MSRFSQLVLLALGVFPLALGQLQTIGVITSGVPPVSSSSSTSLTPSSSSRETSSSASTPLPTSSATATTPGDPLVLTTVFTQPSGCAGGMTEVASWSTELWQNIVNPVPTLTLSSCYPSQFSYSAVATTILPPYSQLVCPQDWETYNVTGTYIICCPSGYGVFLPNYQNTTRPGLGAVCTSSIWPNALMDITSYDATGAVTVISTIAGDDGAIVFATAFDGTKATAVASSTPTTGSSTSTSVSGTTSVPTATASSTTSTPITTAATITAISQLPSCGQTCFNNMLAQYDSLGCTTSDPSCLCRNINFYYGIRDCANAACGTPVASTVLAFESGYCSSAVAAETTSPATVTSTSTSPSASPTAISDLPACGQTCFNNMLGQYSSLGCSSPDPSCLCQNINFYYGIRDCSNGACGTAVATTILAFESSYCASATAAATAPK